MLTYQITDEEKRVAEKALLWFEHCVKVLHQANEHLNLIYDPFKQTPDATPEQVFQYRSALRLYRDKVADNFNLFKKVAFKCYVIMQPFTSDTQTEKILKSFVMAIDDIEKQVNRCIDLFSNLKAPDFTKSLITAIDNIKKEIAELEQIIDDRIKTHIQTNILARNWVDNIGQELQEKVEKKSPLVMELVKQREEKSENNQ